MTAHKKGISSCQLARDIDVTQKSAWFMTQRIRYAMKTKTVLKPMKNTVEADETYVGGKRHKGKTGRGSENKTPVFGLVEREKGEVRSMPVANAKKETLAPIIRENVSPSATIMTDEWGAYKGLSKDFKGHKVINHSAGQYARKGVHVNTIENFWSLLKRGIIGIYHHVSREHLHRYCDEFQFRYNSRERGDANRFEMMLGACEGRLTYNALIGQPI
jgi:transposase-like protein